MIGMSNKMRVTAIELTTADGAVVKLSPAEAKDLYHQLGEMFGSKIQYVPSNPVIIERDRFWPQPWAPRQIRWSDEPRKGQVMCEATAPSGMSMRLLGRAE